MKIYLILLTAVFCGFIVNAQVNETINVGSAKEIKMSFKWPELIKVSSWDKNEVSITGKALINNGENDKAFKIQHELDGSVLHINSIIENIDDLPKRIVIRRDGMNHYFDTDDFDDPKVQAFLEEKGGAHQYQSYGVIKEITLEIKVPVGLPLYIESKYGMVELSDLNAPVTVNAKYGGIDMSFSPTGGKEIVARTKFGELYSDLDLTVDQSESESGAYFNWTTVVARQNGNGPKYQLESKFGNVYLRKKK